MNTQETERERMIRLGEMTPFGTTMSFTEPSRKTQQQKKQQAPAMTDFEKAMLEKDGLAMEKHKKIAMANKMARKRRLEREKEEKEKKKREEERAKRKKILSEKSSKKGKSKKQKMSKEKEQSSPKERSENTFEDGTFFVYKPTRSESSEFPRQRKKRKSMGYTADLRPNWGSDDEMSDYDNGNVLDDSDEYQPDVDEVIDYEEDEDYVPPGEKYAQNTGAVFSLLHRLFINDPCPVCTH